MKSCTIFALYVSGCFGSKSNVNQPLPLNICDMSCFLLNMLINTACQSTHDCRSEHSFGAVDDRCDMELDETDAAVWSKLETATQEYVDANAAVFQAACNVLSPPPQADGLWHDKARSTRGGTRGSQLGKGLLLFNLELCYFFYSVS